MRWTSRCLDRRDPGIHDSGTISIGDRPDPGSDDLDSTRARAARSAGSEAATRRETRRAGGNPGNEHPGVVCQGAGVCSGQTTRGRATSRGFLGLEWVERKRPNGGRGHSSAHRLTGGERGLVPGDRIQKINRRAIDGARAGARRFHSHNRATRWPWSSAAAKAATIATLHSQSPETDFKK